MKHRSKDPDSADHTGAPPRSDTIKQSAHQIWLAGLGAFAKAQEEGGKVFEALVQEGQEIQRKTQTAAETRLADAAQRVSGLAAGLSSQAGGQWDKLENLFEDRLSRALDRLGVPSTRDIEMLSARIDELNRRLAELNAGPAAPRARKARTAAQRPARKPAAD